MNRIEDPFDYQAITEGKKGKKNEDTNEDEKKEIKIPKQ